MAPPGAVLTSVSSSQSRGRCLPHGSNHERRPVPLPLAPSLSPRPVSLSPDAVESPLPLPARRPHADPVCPVSAELPDRPPRFSLQSTPWVWARTGRTSSCSAGSPSVASGDGSFLRPSEHVGAGRAPRHPSRWRRARLPWRWPRGPVLPRSQQAVPCPPASLSPPPGVLSPAPQRCTPAPWGLSSCTTCSEEALLTPL